MVIIAIVGALVFILIAIVVVAVRLDAVGKRNLLMKFRSACRNLGLEQVEEGWVGSVEGQHVVSRLWQMPVTSRSRASLYIQTQVCIDPPAGNGPLVFSGASRPGAEGVEHASKNEVLPWIAPWADRPLPQGGTYRDTWESHGTGPLFRLEMGQKEFDRWFFVFTADPDCARAVLEGNVADAMVAAASPDGYLWFDGTNIELLLDLAAPGTLTEMIGGQRAVAGRLAATVAGSAQHPVE